MSSATIIDQDHRNDVKMFKFQVERPVVILNILTTCASIY